MTRRRVGLHWRGLVTHPRKASRFVLAALALGLAFEGVSARALAEPGVPAAHAPERRVAQAAPQTAPAAIPQGIAVVGMSASREEANRLARAIYGSGLRPRRLDELRARILAGAPVPQGAARDVRDLAELRAGVNGEDAASRRLLGAIAQQLSVEGLLVVEVASPPAANGDLDAGAPEDAGEAPTPAPQVTARLFLAPSGELDAARYLPDAATAGPGAWSATVASLERRFPPRAAHAAAAPPVPTAAPTLPSEGAHRGSPFYASGWFWGAIGAAALIGGAILLASQDTSDRPIHLEMRLPR